MDRLHVVDGGIREAQYHMTRDEKFLKYLSSENSNAVFCFYEWRRPSITYGYFIDPAKHLDMEAVVTAGIDHARRPTGGGILFHGDDFAFTIVIPRSHKRYSDTILENYRWINEACAATLQTLSVELFCVPSYKHEFTSFCMATPTKYDLLMNGKKVGGSAQRKTKFGYIHQASIFLSPINWELFEGLLLDKEAMQFMQQESSYLTGISRKELLQSLINCFGH